VSEFDIVTSSRGGRIRVLTFPRDASIIGIGLPMMPTLGRRSPASPASPTPPVATIASGWRRRWPHHGTRPAHGDLCYLHDDAQQQH